MSKEHRPIAVIQEELDAANKQLKYISTLADELEEKLADLHNERYKLVGKFARGGTIRILEEELRIAKRFVSDSTKPNVVWKHRMYGSSQFIIAKVTEKLIFVRHPGQSHCDRFLRDGSSPSRWSKDQIDIRQTFGINADVLPDDFRFSEKTK